MWTAGDEQPEWAGPGFTLLVNPPEQGREAASPRGGAGVPGRWLVVFPPVASFSDLRSGFGYVAERQSKLGVYLTCMLGRDGVNMTEAEL